MTDLKDIKRYQQIHAEQRAEERLNRIFTEDDNRQIIHLIKGKRFVKKEISKRKPVYSLWYCGDYIRVVLDRKTNQIVTFLPEEELF